MKVWIGSALLAAAAVCAEESAPLQQQQMRPVDRDWAYFSALPCEQLPQATVHSEVERRLLERRRRDCQERYKAFMSGGASR